MVVRAVGGENSPPEPEAGFDHHMVAGFGFPEVGLHRIPDFGFKNKFNYQLEKFFLTSKVSNEIRINNLIKNIL